MASSEFLYCLFMVNAAAVGRMDELMGGVRRVDQSLCETRGLWPSAWKQIRRGKGDHTDENSLDTRLIGREMAVPVLHVSHNRPAQAQFHSNAAEPRELVSSHRPWPHSPHSISFVASLRVANMPPPTFGRPALSTPLTSAASRSACVRLHALDTSPDRFPMRTNFGLPSLLERSERGRRIGCATSAYLAAH